MSKTEHAPNDGSPNTPGTVGNQTCRACGTEHTFAWTRDHPKACAECGHRFNAPLPGDEDTAA